MTKLGEWLKKKIIDEEFWLNIGFGIFGALVVSKLLPLKIENLLKIKLNEISDAILNDLIWGSSFFYITEFVKTVRNLRRDLKLEWNQFQINFMGSISNALHLSTGSHIEWRLLRYNLDVIQKQQSHRGSVLFKNRKVEEYVELIKDILSG